VKIDNGFKEYATAKQWDYYKAYCECGQYEAAGQLLNVNESTVRKMCKAVFKKAALNGYAPDYDMTKTMAPGFEVIGTSTLYDAEGNQSMQWVKTKQSLIDIEEKITSAVEVLSEEVRGESGIPAYDEKDYTDASKLSVYPVTDLHVGMLAWGKECGEDQDLRIIEGLAMEAVERVVAGQPNSAEAVICFMGDYFHFDDDSNETRRSGNELDGDGRTDKVFKAGIRIARKIISRVAQKHESVKIIVLPGNHDEYLSMAMKYVLRAYLEDSDRIEVKMTHGVFGYHEFGNTLIAFHHGHTAKPAKMYEVVTSDQREAWGRVQMCHVLTGHVHHESVKDIGMCKIETIRTVAAKDSYAAAGGYRAPRTMYGITYDWDQGECGRTMYNILPPCKKA
jgi:hypothetical protein